MKQALERIAQMKPSQRSYETKRAQKAGLSLEARLCQKIPVDPLPAEIDEFIEICAGLESKMDRSEKFDHAHILGDAEFEELMRRKIALLQSINKKKLILAMR